MRTVSTPLFLKLFPAYLLIVLLVFLQMSHFGSAFIKTPPSLAIQTNATIENPNPIYLSAPSVGLGLIVQEGGYDYEKKDWILTDQSAYFARMTSVPNRKEGNTLIYAHNFANLFGMLQSLRIGDTVTVKVQDGRHFIYEFTSLKQVVPEDLSILSYKGPPQLTLLTCGGLWDTKRQMYFFRLKEIH